MSPIRRARLCFAWIVPVAAFAWVTVGAEILINPVGWLFPNIITSSKEAIRLSDRTPLIPGKETMRKGYRKRDGTYFQTYAIEGRVFGVEIDDNGKPPFEFSIIDTDGDGKFESKIIHEVGNKDHAYVPQWVIDYYFSLHPEVKDGSGPVPVPSFTPAKPPAKSATPEKEPPEKEPPPPEARERPNP